MKTLKTTLLPLLFIGFIAVAMDFALAVPQTVTGYAIGREQESELARNGASGPLTRQNKATQAAASYELELRTNIGDYVAKCSEATYYAAKPFKEETITLHLGYFSGHCWSVEVVE